MVAAKFKQGFPEKPINDVASASTAQKQERDFIVKQQSEQLLENLN
jgi:hypothetical protein